MDFREFVEDLALVKKIMGRMLFEFFDAKHLCIANTWFGKADIKR